ncbi:MAG: selenide, water dikinase SelD [Calditrichaeota bacterium]|nr:selenide, water dikinase SelD [Calditrichota bacterium]
MKPIYLDYNATTPIDPEVAEAMMPYLREAFGNPSSSHWYGNQTKKAVEEARRQLADLLGCQPDEVVFTGGGSESNNWAVKGVAEAHREKGTHIITSQIEHDAILNPCRYLEHHGFRVTYLPVDEYGMVKMEAFREALTDDTILVTIMTANNEVGTIQPIAEIARLAHEKGILVHTDASQAVGKIPVNVNELGVDLLTVAGHKFYAPKGIGALYIRRGTQLERLIHGAGHEQGRRAGTENVLEIVGLGKAAEMAKRDLQKNRTHYTRLRDRLWKGLKEQIPDLRLNGHPEKRLPNTLNVTFPGIDSNTLLSELEELAASAGAACHTDVTVPSGVLVAMHVPVEAALGTIRFSVGKWNTEDEIDRAIQMITDAVKRLRPPEEKSGGMDNSVTADMKEIKLTHFTHGLGCACKLRPQNLEKVLQSLPKITDPNVVVGTETADDAAVYRLKNGTVLVQTVDFFTPIVDSPYHFGAIAAANSLSDIYAMGGRPLFGLNIVGFPEKRLPLSVLEEILRGAQDKAAEAGMTILGGHTVEDSEPKFGLAVTGVIESGRVITNAGALPGDALILTKPVGVGIISTAIKKGLVDSSAAEKAILIMSELNRAAAEAMIEVGAHACTDVTGFGLLGHLKELTAGSRVDAEIFAERVPIIDEAYALANAGVVPGGTLSNLDYVKEVVEWDDRIPTVIKRLLCDAQTSGGLIISISPEKKQSLINKLKEKGVLETAYIGNILEAGTGQIRVRH